MMTYERGIDMSYAQMYADKLVSAEEAVKIVQSGDWVDYGFCVNHPKVVDVALAKRLVNEPDLVDLNFRGGVAMWQPEVTKIEDALGRITWNSWHTGGIERKLMSQGFVFYQPLRYSEMPRYYRENIGHVNVACFQVTPMDEHGYFNFGVSASHLAALCEVTDNIIVEVNKNMPRVHGGYEQSIHISQVKFVVEGENPDLNQLGAGVPSEVDQAVAKLILPEIPSGACLQLGIGGMPNAVGMMIADSDLKDLGIHTEMYVDAFVDIAKAGKITGKHKALNPGRQVFTFAAGTQKLYDYIHENPEIMAAPVDYVNDVRIISAHDNFISINNAIEVDLFGQVVSETAGTRHISGAGGALDFVLGAYLSKGGKSFICCSSAVAGKDGALKSRITPFATPGSVVTAARPNTHYIATEYGLVNLKGTTTWQRAEKIISVAHPQFRDELVAQAEKLGIWRQSNKR